MDAEKSNRPVDDHIEVAIDPSEDARLATAEEHRLTIREGLRKHYKACLWCMAISLTVVMDGYDGALLGSLSAFPSFRSSFGRYVDAESGYQLDAHWQLALGCSSPVGNIVGIYLGAYTVDRLGYKRSALLWLTWLTGCIFISFFAKHLSVIFVGELLCGISWGVFATLAPPYAAELCPVVLRGLVEIWVVMCWGIGQLLSYSVLFTLNHNTTQWGWRIPFAIQWVWPAIIAPLVLFAPESPWWLVRHGRREEAERVVKRLVTGGVTDEQVRRSVALMVETNRLEQSMHEGVGYLDCFRGTNRWRTEIACAAWSAQLWCGFVIASYSTYFFELAGLQSEDAYKMSVGQGCLHLLFNIISVFFVANFGRRRLYLSGLAFMGLMMFLLGFVALAPQTSAVGYASSAIFLIWNCGYQLTVGPSAYILVSEVSSTRLRSKTVALARNAYNVSLLINYFVSPYILNPSQGNWKGKTGFLTGGIIILFGIWTFFRLPETKGRTFEELDILFSKKELKARDFKSYEVGPEDLQDHKLDTSTC
ncbi:general substrate transporter [Aspergillus lucknowensis]|uniref:General substrate transporter n=1 Tax=Aspergillus lucknowensis TaxID=176173 RepID=A0ABR4LHZ5_9EURO